LRRWIEAVAQVHGLEADPIRATYGEIGDVVRSAGPALLYVDAAAHPYLVALAGARAKAQVAVVALDHREILVPRSELEGALLCKLDALHGARVDEVLERARIPPARRARARAALVRDPFARVGFDAGWAVRVPPSAPFFGQLRRAGVTRLVARVLVADVAVQLLTILAWATVGRGALSGTLEGPWLVAWALLLLTMLPIRVASTWWQGRVGVRAGALLKRRLLLGALRLDEDEFKHQGVGQLLGRVIESDALESLAIGGGFASVLALIDVAIALPVLAAGPAGLVASILLVGWTLLTLFVSWVSYVRARAWTDARIAMTDDLVERMVGHRTRLAQEPASSWHDDEDRALAAYVDRSTALDRTSVVVAGLLSRGWLVAGLATLVPAFVHATASPALLAVGVGGVMLGRSAIGRLASSAASVVATSIAWQKAGPLFRAAARPELTAAPSVQVLQQGAPSQGEPLIEAHNVVFRYQAQGRAALDGVSLRIDAGDRVLVEGPSGGGKSTLASVLTGLRSPESGLVLLAGLDRPTLGSLGWRRRVTTAPQFHQNHVLSGTLAYNLLMGRGWPAEPADLAEAERICHELGLAPLLERMPAGIMQLVGETGWQLSHGEQSRLFIARALLHHADLVVLDESFAALDPVTLGASLRCVLARAPTLVVIAHP
jgi:ATP-binding cassette subfamily B protein